MEPGGGGLSVPLGLGVAGSPRACIPSLAHPPIVLYDVKGDSFATKHRGV